jgi:hypothetical protein
MSLARLIDKMVSAGMSAGDAGAIAAEIYAAGVASATDGRSSSAIRQQRYRDRKTVTERNDSVTERNYVTAQQNVTERNETVTSYDSTVSPIYTKIKNSKRQNSERASRGTRIDPQWSPSPTDRQAASDEGLSAPEIDREALRFRDYWAARAGSGGVKLDWPATWRNWVRSTAEKLGRLPKSQSAQAVGSSFLAQPDSEEIEAWDAYGLQSTGKSFPRDKNGCWRFPQQWPPGYVKPDRSFQVPPAILNRMQ